MCGTGVAFEENAAASLSGAGIDGARVFNVAAGGGEFDVTTVVGDAVRFNESGVVDDGGFELIGDIGRRH